MVGDTIRYLSKSDVRSLELSISDIADAIERILKAKQANTAWSSPNSVISVAQGSRSVSFHSAGLDPAYSMHKTLGLSSANSERGLPHMGGLINVHDVQTGLPLAVIECTEITGLRTAALSLLATRYLAPPKMETIGFIGAGQQAMFHLKMLAKNYPFKRAFVYEPEERCSEALVQDCRLIGLKPTTARHWQKVLEESDVLVTSLPDGPGFQPFLDASYVPRRTLILSVDSARSWLQKSLLSLDRLVVDDLNSHAKNRFITAKAPTEDLSTLISAGEQTTLNVKSGFFFAGIALADLAAVGIALRAARARNIGHCLPV